MPCTIVANQLAFVANWQIFDATLMANELIDDWSFSNKMVVVLKLDCEKAFDTVDWDFLTLCFRQKVLLFYGKLGSDVASLVLITPSLLMNVLVGRLFQPLVSSGEIHFPQFLFIFVVDCLSSLLDHSSSMGFNVVHPIENSTFSLNHLQFADDTLLFSIAE